jgi:hypothetical protein
MRKPSIWVLRPCVYVVSPVFGVAASVWAVSRWPQFVYLWLIALGLGMILEDHAKVKWRGLRWAPLAALGAFSWSWSIALFFCALLAIFATLLLVLGTRRPWADFHEVLGAYAMIPWYSVGQAVRRPKLRPSPQDSDAHPAAPRPPDASP